MRSECPLVRIFIPEVLVWSGGKQCIMEIIMIIITQVHRSTPHLTEVLRERNQCYRLSVKCDICIQQANEAKESLEGPDCFTKFRESHSRSVCNHKQVVLVGLRLNHHHHLQTWPLKTKPIGTVDKVLINMLSSKGGYVDDGRQLTSSFPPPQLVISVPQHELNSF